MSALDQMWGRTADEQRTAGATGTYLLAVNNDVEFLFRPFDGHVQVGMGGEWWNGWITDGENVLHHRKERVDPGYRPVRVKVTAGRGSPEMRFDVSGGFGYSARFKLKLLG